MTTPSRARIPNRWLRFLGPKLGLAKGLRYLAIDPDDFDLHHVIPVVTSLAKLLGHPDAFEPRAGGVGERLEDAINRAMGELLERYASFAYDGIDQTASSYTEIIKHGRRPVPLEYLLRFSPKQYRSPGFPYGEFTETTRLDWIEGTNLLDGCASYVPAQLVSLGYRPSSDLIPPCFYATSSGCAVATSVEEALLKGILELIERDAVMIRWYFRIPPPLLDINPKSLLAERLGSQAHALETRFHDLTVDGDVPVVGVTCIERTGRRCFFLLSAACALDVSTAARKALLEVGQGRPFVKSLAGKSEAAQEGAVFNDFDSNVRFYGDPSNSRYAEWFVQNTSLSTRPVATVPGAQRPEEGLRVLLDRCATMGFTPIAFDMTTPEMQDSGLFACKVFVPQLVPLGVPSAPFLGHPRLARFTASRSTESAALAIPDWVPHPFP
jgi:ribosomal protein S12 methylthiotransferase accessory factor